LADVLRQIPISSHPNLLVGIENSDDAGLLMLPNGSALVQTVDFFTPVVDDPYAYGQIAAANALSDIYAMGGYPISVLNIACFDPKLAPAEVWGAVLRGMADKTQESGAAIMGGHTVEDREPKFGMAVTGLVNPDESFVNTAAIVGDRIYLSKPLGTGIVTTAAKCDAASSDEIEDAIRTMTFLNREASEVAKARGVRCATDITGFGLIGHLYNIARASRVSIEIEVNRLPLLLGAERLAIEGHTTGGADKNLQFIEPNLQVGPEVLPWQIAICSDHQTSGGLALVSSTEIAEYPCIGKVVTGNGQVILR
jgi:selenide,water dikinase